MSKNQFTLVLENSYKVTPHILHLVFRPEDGTSFDYTPGQFITIHFELDGVELKRSYSIASRQDQSDAIEIAASYVADGPGTLLLYDLKPGDTIKAGGPLGRLVLRDEPLPAPRLILVATGTGVTPYRAMLPELAKRLIKTPEMKALVILGVQRREDLLYGEDFIAFAQTHPNFEFRVHYSREDSTELAPYEHRGYVQTCFDALDLNPENDIIYLCGNPNMIDTAFTDLKERGFAIGNIRRERYVSPPTPKAKIEQQ